MVLTLCSPFLNPLIDDYLEFFDTPAPAHSNYTLFLTRETKEKGKRWKKNTILLLLLLLLLLL